MNYLGLILILILFSIFALGLGIVFMRGEIAELKDTINAIKGNSEKISELCKSKPL